MPRKARKKSESGVYHVMLRGINQQQIFEDNEDREKFIQVLTDCKAISKYKMFAYCLMGNHVHLLLKVEAEDLEQIFKRIGGRYVYWYNVKYQRTGHLFQDRFKSEPVETDKYFLAAIRYIHQNPIKAGLSHGLDYAWSSYHEYQKPLPKQLTDVETAYEIMSAVEFIAFNQQKSSDRLIEVDEKKPNRMTDSQAKQLIEKLSKCKNINEFQKLDIEKRNLMIIKFKESGMSIRQISRLTGVPFGIVRK